MAAFLRVLEVSSWIVTILAGLETLGVSDFIPQTIVAPGQNKYFLILGLILACLFRVIRMKFVSTNIKNTQVQIGGKKNSQTMK